MTAVQRVATVAPRDENCRLAGAHEDSSSARIGFGYHSEGYRLQQSWTLGAREEDHGTSRTACLTRMACAKCSFYQPKGSTQAQLLEGKANLQHMLQEIPLSEEERAAVEDGISAMERLCLQLADVPTPAGPTPKQLAARNQEKETIIPLERVRRKRQSE